MKTPKKTHFRIRRSYRAPNLNSPDKAKFMRKVPIYDWGKIDINRPTKEIMKETGCCYGTIYKIQRQRGIVVRNPNTSVGREVWETVNFSKSDSQIGRELNCTGSTVYAWRRRLGKLQPKAKPKNWTKVDFTKPVMEICNEMECSLSTAFRRKRAAKTKEINT